MANWLIQVGELPTALLLAVLGLVMLLDAIPLVGVLVPGDAAVLAAVGVGPGGGPGAVAAVVGGCVTGWSLSFGVGRRFGDRLRHSRVGDWIGEPRWAAAEALLGRGGGRMVLIAPFLPVFNTLLPLAAGGLRMSYRRFVACAAAGSALWAGLYVLLGTAARTFGDLLPGESFALLGTMAVGLLLGSVVLLGTRRRLRAELAVPTPAGPSGSAVATPVGLPELAVATPAGPSGSAVAIPAGSPVLAVLHPAGVGVGTAPGPA